MWRNIGEREREKNIQKWLSENRMNIARSLKSSSNIVSPKTGNGSPPEKHRKNEQCFSPDGWFRFASAVTQRKHANDYKNRAPAHQKKGPLASFRLIFTLHLEHFLGQTLNARARAERKSCTRKLLPAWRRRRHQSTTLESAGFCAPSRARAHTNLNKCGDSILLGLCLCVCVSGT